MSHYGSVKDVSPRSRRFRFRFMALSVGFAFLASCGRQLTARVLPDPVLETMEAGYDAFRSGDQDGLAADIQTLNARLPADETQGDFVDCSPRRDALRQIERSKRKLQYLAASPAISMGEEERYVYFQQLIEGRVPIIDTHGHAVLELTEPYDPLNPRNAINGRTDFECQDASDDKALSAANAEDAAIQTMGRNRMRDWLSTLRRSFEAQLDPRMQNAAVELDGYGLRPDPKAWSPPGS
jgi:hypothetical protein